MVCCQGRQRFQVEEDVRTYSSVDVRPRPVGEGARLEGRMSSRLNEVQSPLDMRWSIMHIMKVGRATYMREAWCKTYGGQPTNVVKLTVGDTFGEEADLKIRAFAMAYILEVRWRHFHHRSTIKQLRSNKTSAGRSAWQQRR